MFRAVRSLRAAMPRLATTPRSCLCAGAGVAVAAAVACGTPANAQQGGTIRQQLDSILSRVNALEKTIGDGVCGGAAADLSKNSAFVFLKPHACTEAAKELVKKELEAKGFTILAERGITGQEIDTNMYIDRHYYAIASKARAPMPRAPGMFSCHRRENIEVAPRARVPSGASLPLGGARASARTAALLQATLLQPSELNVPADKFKGKFGIEWGEALDRGVVRHARRTSGQRVARWRAR